MKEHSEEKVVGVQGPKCHKYGQQVLNYWHWKRKQIHSMVALLSCLVLFCCVLFKSLLEPDWKPPTIRVVFFSFSFRNSNTRAGTPTQSVSNRDKIGNIWTDTFVSFYCFVSPACSSSCCCWCWAWSHPTGRQARNYWLEPAIFSQNHTFQMKSTSTKRQNFEKKVNIKTEILYYTCMQSLACNLFLTFWCTLHW